MGSMDVVFGGIRVEKEGDDGRGGWHAGWRRGSLGNRRGGRDSNEGRDNDEGQEGWLTAGWGSFWKGSLSQQWVVNGVTDGFGKREGCEESEQMRDV